MGCKAFEINFKACNFWLDTSDSGGLRYSSHL